VPSQAHAGTPLALLLAAFLIACTATAQPTWYVDDDAPLGGDGTSWDTAFKHLQDALWVALAGDEIRVAQGTYKPDQDEAGNVTPGARETPFSLKNGVAIYGGYAGLTDPEHPDARDIDAYESILSGDLNGDDGPNFENNEENTAHVVLAMDIDDSDTILDGVTIARGYANSEYCCFYRRGAGLYVVRAAPTVRNCTFVANMAAGAAAGEGGGAYITTDSEMTMANCRFTGNQATKGGGVFITSASPTLIDCEFVENAAGGGGGIDSRYGDPTLIGCRFEGNSAFGAGVGAMHVSCGSPTLVGCSFNGNIGGGMQVAALLATLVNCRFVANEGGPALHHFLTASDSNLTLANCLFADNTGEAIFIDAYYPSIPTTMLVNCAIARNALGAVNLALVTQPEVVNCILWGNGSGIEQDQLNHGPLGIVPFSVNYSCVQGWTGYFGGVGNFGHDPLFADPDSGDFHLTDGSPCIDAADNTAVPQDVADLDRDGDITERTPLDLDGILRFVDDPTTDDTGVPDLPDYPYVVDMGAYELGIFGDLDGDCDVDLSDLARLLTNYGTTSGAAYDDGDLDCDGDVDLTDLAALLAVYGSTCPQQAAGS